MLRTVVVKLKKSNYFKVNNKMISGQNSFCEIKNIFNCSVEAVRPKELISSYVRVLPNYIEIKGNHFYLDKNVYVVGFGKAVLGMALEINNLLQDHIVSGIISIPKGLNKIIQTNTEDSLSKFKVFEGAQNNIPDDDSFQAAKAIYQLVASLEKSSLLIVLISGGGSALLPYPKPPLSLEEKQTIIKTLASKGATIEEINVVRKRLSVLKGGGLIELAKPAQVVSLILSDIIGDPLGLIASAPTVPNSDDPSLPLTIIEKYNVKDGLPKNAINLLNDIKETKLNNNSHHVNNFIIGNNTIALEAAEKMAEKLSYKPIIMTNKLCGTAHVVGQSIINLIHSALQQDNQKVKKICEEINIENEIANTLQHEINNFDEKYKGVCILFGGETTVEVIGKGIGGRNQELALAASLEMCNKKMIQEVVLLSAGTDGIDGPTDAAGAIGTPILVDIARTEKLDATSYLNNNDSYTFYSLLCNGEFHLKIGHTGTNVMDIIIVLVSNRKI